MSNHGAFPAGRIISNAGAEKHKPSASTINCIVSGKIVDSMEGILQGAKEAGLTLARGCGVGYNFSTLRPRGASVSGAGASTSGPLSFMEIYDKVCFTVSSAGGRRGAQMATFHIWHPDIMEFISAKRKDGAYRQFNFSVLITDEFIEAVIKDRDWKLSFPLLPNEVPKEDQEYLARDGQTHKVYKTIRAKNLWNLIMSSTYDYAEPGFLLIDEVNRMNPLSFCEDITACNPCGEQNLPFKNKIYHLMGHAY